MKLVLKKFLELPGVYPSIVKSLDQNEFSSVISSMVQGSVWQSIRIRFKDKRVIPLNLVSDAYEANNPLGSHRGLKKMNGVYYSISCLPPEFANRLENFFLAQIHREKDYTEFGNKIIFSRLIKEMVELANDGIVIDIDGREETVYFAVARILGDNLGLNALLGFERSFNATYFCRTCEATKTMTKTQATERKVLLRNKNKYQKDVSNCTRGIKEECVFNPVIDHICELPTVDPTHDINEGIARYGIREILYNLILVEKFFTVKQVNERLLSVNKQLAAGTNVPPPFSRQQVKKKMIKVSASEMTFLILHLGVLVGKYVPADHKMWQLYKMLRKIYCLVMAPSFTQKTPNSLKSLITRHHKLYLELIGKLKPKHHFLLHYSLAMKKLGLLRYVATIRYAAKHKEFKHTANMVTTRINLGYTLAQKHQLQLAYRFYLNKPLENSITFGKQHIHRLTLLDNVESFKDALPEGINDQIRYLSWIKFDGTIYKVGMAVCIQPHNSLPSFGEIKHIFESDDKIYFVIRKLETVKKIEHLQSYHVRPTENWQVMTKDFPSHITHDIFVLPCELYHVLFRAFKC
uniref:Cya protein n=1 Tax=Fopius arisanus TaxID=64838 RepID=A0A0C9RKV5_9HYME